ncbi:MAG TPA: membrane dipeptidase [Herpetosiphonaceae bacterium]|nr:membrane dipeptidase [Herpetosiphonaceae bacterium]
MDSTPEAEIKPGTPLVDAHLDLAYNALEGEDARLPIDELRESEIGRLLSARGQTPTVSLPALKAAGVGVVFGTIFVLPANAPGDLSGQGYTTPGEAFTEAMQQADYYRGLEDDGLIRRISSVSDLRSLLEAFEREPSTTALGVVQLMEGADPIRTPGELRRWVDQGVRIVGPAWRATRYSGGTGVPGPLTREGRELMAELRKEGVALDTSHMAEESFWDALRLFHGPVIASHSNCRRFVPIDRHLSDDMIRAIVDRDGVIGVVLFNAFLDPRWAPGDRKSSISLDAVVRHIEYVCEIARDTRHVGLGSDLDGGFGREAIPAELDSCADLPLIGRALLTAGWSADETADVLGGNWLRWLADSLPAG